MENKKVKNATKITIDGVTYRSKFEARFAQLLKEAGVKAEYEKHTFVLIPPCRYNDKSYRATTYTPDFVGENFFIELKGFSTDTWLIKKKLFIKYLLDNDISIPFYEIKTIGAAKELIKKLKENEY